MVIYKRHLQMRWLVILMGWLLTFLVFTLNPEQVQADSRTFPETGKTVRDQFLIYWDTHGGLPQQGYPISEEMQERSDTDGKVYTVQYFERVVLELHPENVPPYDVLPALLGVLQYKERYPNGAPGQIPNTSSGSISFPQTDKWLGGRFLGYWTQNGSLMQYGYPISDEFQEKNDLDGKIYIVQYFERAVFEYHPENTGTPYEVLLSQLGVNHYQTKYTTQSPHDPTFEIDFLREDGVLYVQQEYFQAQGVSVIRASSPGGALSQPLTTINELWVDAQNPWRYRRATTELLDDGPHLAYASGSNGTDSWWKVDVPKGIKEPERHPGRAPLLQSDPQGRTELTLGIWLEIFSRLGKQMMDHLQRGEAELIESSTRVPFGNLLTIRRVDEHGFIHTATMRAAEPYIAVEYAQEAKLSYSLKITTWGWYAPNALSDDFWMNPPTVGQPNRP